MSTEPVDHVGKAAERARQGTGPSQAFSVLFISLLMAAAAGVAILIYFLMR